MCLKDHDFFRQISKEKGYVYRHFYKLLDVEDYDCISLNPCLHEACGYLLIYGLPT